MDKVPFSGYQGAFFKGVMPESGVRYEEEGDKRASPVGPTIRCLGFSLKAFRQEIRNQEK